MFRTCKYHPAFPVAGFADLTDARKWVGQFVYWYNEQHRHSEIRYVTPAQHPARWSGNTRNWQPVGSVWLNPEKETTVIHVHSELEAA